MRLPENSKARLEAGPCLQLAVRCGETRAAIPRLPPSFDSARVLGELARNATEGALQLGAAAIHDREDRDREAGGDEAVFDGGGAGLVLQETREKLRHVHSSLEVHTWLSELARGRCLIRPIEAMRKKYQRGLASKLIHSVKHYAISWNADVVKNALIWKFVRKITYKKRHNFRRFMRCRQYCIKISIDSVLSSN